MKFKTKIIPRWLKLFHRRRRIHDPFLVFNMAMFNFAGDWHRRWAARA
jgi:hypothetical protein